MGKVLHTTEFTGAMEEFASLARPTWDEKYPNTLLLDFFSPEYLETIRKSSKECFGLVTHYKEAPVSLCLNLGYEASLFGRPIQVLLTSWFSAVNRPDYTSTAGGLFGVVKLCLDVVESARERKYDLVLGLADADSGMLEVAKIKSRGVYPVISRPIVAMARILSKDGLEDMYLNRYEESLLKILGRDWRACSSKDFQIEEVPLLKQGPCEEILNGSGYDFKIMNKFSLYFPKDTSFNKFFRIFDISRRGERVGIVRILDLEIRGANLIPSVVIEQIWAKPHYLRKCLAVFLSAMKREGKSMVMNIFHLQGAWERLIYLSLGFLPDFSRPVRLIMIPTNPEVERELSKIKSFSLPFR